MPYSVKMVKLDFYTFKSQLGNYVSLILAIALFCFMGSSIAILSITAAWFVALLMNNIFMVQEKDGLERLYASLSLDLQNIVLGRYIFIFVNYMAALFFSIVLGTGVLFFKDTSVGFLEIITAICVSLLIFTIIMGIQIPIYFRFGYTKAKTRCLAAFVLVLAVVFLPSFIKVFSNILMVLMKHQMLMNIACLLISTAIFFFSCKTSIRCYKKRR